ncbi:MAG TPA: tyrosine--tRNA ligase [Acidimicrobiales bacterium]|nr:tyrosine--tRNA ligase [Acidimicrobiales bacterium]
MGLFDELQWRGLVHDFTDPALPGLLDQGGLVAYIGFDPTADSLHIGNLLQLCNLRRLQEGGHQVIGLAGGATGMIGDPGGKSEERNLLDSDTLATNLDAIERQIRRFLLPGAEFVDNASWTRPMSVLDFLRDVGKHFTINQMIGKEMVRNRIQNPEEAISYTEFSYMLLQAMDFLQLFDTHGCRLQMGASDQWGNITMGVELIRKARGATAYGLTSPLVLKADGKKMGKSESGTIWLARDKTSPYQLFQFLVRSDDRVVGQYLRYFTWLPHDEIEALDEATSTRPERREAQRALAFEVTAFVHGREEAERAVHASTVLFSEEIAGLDEQTLTDVFAEAPSTVLPREPVALVDILASTGLAKSKSDARRHIEAGAVYVNNRKVSDSAAKLDPSADVLHGRWLVLRRGKSSQHLLRFED